jgi:L-2-hydroxyglutarate oxidase LhgO
LANKETLKIDILIVGGGIIGLWSAYKILKKFPDRIVAVFEAESYLGEHTTGRNSEVLHSGLYYPTNSLKHRHCLKGNQMWRQYIAEKNMPFLDCGKVIVATGEQGANLQSLYERSLENEVSGVRTLARTEIETLKQVLHMEDGFFIRSSGVLNASEALRMLKQDIEDMGGMILKNSRVQLLESANEHFLFDVNGDQLESQILVNAAGLLAVALRAHLNLFDFSNFYVKGSYLKLKKKIDIDKLVYPIPPADGLGLGVHLTLDTAGDQKFGPNTEIIAEVEYSVSDSLIYKMSPSIHKIFKNIKESDLLLGYAGVRPKIKRDGELITDFVFNTSAQHGIKGYFEFLGIDSPGLTAAPSLAEMLSCAL